MIESNPATSYRRLQAEMASSPLSRRCAVEANSRRPSARISAEARPSSCSSIPLARGSFSRT